MVRLKLLLVRSTVAPLSNQFLFVLTDTIEVDTLNVGEAIVVTYKSPTRKGSEVSIQLDSGCAENIPVVLTIKYHWPENSVTNTRTAEGFGAAAWVSGVDYGLNKLIEIKFVATESGFDIFSNDNLVTSYAARHTLGPSTVRGASYSCNPSHGPCDSVLESMRAIF
jgi:hypothetical protein